MSAIGEPPSSSTSTSNADPLAMRWLAYALATAWLLFGSTVTAHVRPAWSLPKKITCTLSAVIILILLIATRRKGNTGGAIGCALLFLLFAVFVLGAVWTYVYTLGSDGSILSPEFGPLR